MRGGVTRKLSVKKQKTGIKPNMGQFKKPVTLQLKPEKKQKFGF